MHCGNLASALAAYLASWLAGRRTANTEPLPRLARHGHIAAHHAHKNIQHTLRYSELSPERFRDFWKD